MAENLATILSTSSCDSGFSSSAIERTDRFSDLDPVGSCRLRRRHGSV
jgi:hypothetical protein